MLIYRIENQSGVGMYAGDRNGFSIEMTDKMRHPLPTEDAALKDTWRSIGSRDTYSFGFSSMEQLKSWIYRSDWRKLINDDGFKVVVYEAADFFIGDTQAIFRKSTATMQFTLSLLEI